MKKILFCSLLCCFSLAMAAQEAQPAEEAFTINHGPYLQNPGTDEMTIFFTTSSKAFSWVEVRGGTWTEAHRFVNEEDGLINAYNTQNAIRITGLQPATHYEYRLVSQQMTKFRPYSISYGDTITTGWESFTTLDPKATSLTFLMLNDGHDNADKVRKLLTTFPLDKVDMVFYNGDMISHYDDLDQPYKGFLDVSTELFAKNKPFIYVRGNHETRGNMARTYKELIGRPDGHFYHAWYIGNTVVVVLDTGEDKPDETPVYAGINDFDGLRTEQAVWLAREVKSKAFRKAKHKLVMMHIPPVVTPDIPAGEEHANVQLRDELLPIFNKAGIQLSLSGHTHKYFFYDKGEKENKFPVVINDNHSAALVTVDNNGIHVTIVNDKGETKLDKQFK